MQMFTEAADCHHRMTARDEDALQVLTELLVPVDGVTTGTTDEGGQWIAWQTQEFAVSIVPLGGGAVSLALLCERTGDVIEQYVGGGLWEIRRALAASGYGGGHEPMGS